MLRTTVILLLRAVAVLLMVTFFTFCITYSDGIGIARTVLGLNASDEQVAAKAVELGLDQPLIVQYLDWLSGLVRGDLGASFLTGQQVTDALSTRVPVTLSLIILTMILTTIISVVLGVTSALYGGWLDRVLQFISVLGAAVPGYILAIGLIFAFAIAIPLLPRHRLHPDHGRRARVAVVAHAAGDSTPDRRDRERGSSVPRIRSRRSVAGLRAHAPLPRHPGIEAALPPRAAQRGRPRPRRPQPHDPRPLRRRALHRSDLRAPRSRPAVRLRRARRATCPW